MTQWNTFWATGIFSPQLCHKTVVLAKENLENQGGRANQKARTTETGEPQRERQRRWWTVRCSMRLLWFVMSDSSITMSLFRFVMSKRPYKWSVMEKGALSEQQKESRESNTSMGSWRVMTEIKESKERNHSNEMIISKVWHKGQVLRWEGKSVWYITESKHWYIKPIASQLKESHLITVRLGHEETSQIQTYNCQTELREIQREDHWLCKDRKEDFSHDNGWQRKLLASWLGRWCTRSEDLVHINTVSSEGMPERVKLIEDLTGLPCK